MSILSGDAKNYSAWKVEHEAVVRPLGDRHTRIARPSMLQISSNNTRFMAWIRSIAETIRYRRLSAPAEFSPH